MLAFIQNPWIFFPIPKIGSGKKYVAPHQCITNRFFRRSLAALKNGPLLTRPPIWYARSHDLKERASAAQSRRLRSPWYSTFHPWPSSKVASILPQYVRPWTRTFILSSQTRTYCFLIDFPHLLRVSPPSEVISRPLFRCIHSCAG